MKPAHEKPYTVFWREPVYGRAFRERHPDLASARRQAANIRHEYDDYVQPEIWYWLEGGEE